MIIDNDEKTVNDDENYLPSFCNSLSYNTLGIEEYFCLLFYHDIYSDSDKLMFFEIHLGKLIQPEGGGRRKYSGGDVVLPRCRTAARYLREFKITETLIKGTNV